MQRDMANQSAEELIRAKLFPSVERERPTMASGNQAMVVEVPRDGKPIMRIRPVPQPEPGEHQARVRVVSAAQNPTDGK